jgi:RHS repeat-associated protein
VKVNRLKLLYSNVIGQLLLLMLATVGIGLNLVRAETTTAQRGASPYQTYSISGIENIDVRTGSFTLSIPLASLPGIAGHSYTLYYIYNNRLWDLDQWPTEDCPAREPCSGPGPGVVLLWEQHEGKVLKEDSFGGWRLGYKWTVKADLGIPNPPGPGSRYELIAPDGSAHVVNFGGGSDSGVYSSLAPGTWGYTIDGSYLRFQAVTVDATGYPTSWKVRTRAGTDIDQLVTGEQRITDRNGNIITIVTTGGPSFITTITDSAGRKIEIIESRDPGNNLLTETIRTTRFGGAVNDVIVEFDPNLNRFINGKSYQYNKATRLQQEWTSAGCSVPHCADRPTACTNSTDCVVYSSTSPERPAKNIRKITLTAGLFYEFTYNDEACAAGFIPASCPTEEVPPGGWGEIWKMRLPTGGTVRYKYHLDPYNAILFNPPQGSPTLRSMLNNGVSEKKVQADGQTALWTWQRSAWWVEGGSTEVTITDPVGTQAKYYFSRYGTSAGQYFFREIKREEPFGTTVLKRTETVWVENRPSSWTLGPPGSVMPNLYPQCELTKIYDPSGANPKTSAMKTFQNLNGHVEVQHHFDWQAGELTNCPAESQALRKTVNTYYWQTPDYSQGNLAKRTLSAQFTSQVQTPAGAAVSQAEFYYDDPATTANLTQEKIWNSATASWVTVSHEYGTCGGGTTGCIEVPGCYGNRTATIDARGNRTEFTYTDNYQSGGNRCSFAHVTKIKSPAPLNHETMMEYDYWTGLNTKVTDPNNQITTYNYDDSLNRLKNVTRPDGGQTNITYCDQVGIDCDSSSGFTALTVLEKDDLNGPQDRAINRVTRYDALGRVKQTELIAPDGMKVDTKYDLLGRVWVVTNPYRNTATDPTMGWTRTQYDTLGRVKEVRSYDGAVPADPDNPPVTTTTTGAMQTAYSSNMVLVTDQAGKQRLSQSNGLGQLTDVWEIVPADVNDSAQVSVSFAGQTLSAYPTHYDYDVLDNLIKVTQPAGTLGTQTRTFVYDSLKRLVSATNPESCTLASGCNTAGDCTVRGDGTTCYQYDANGNLIQRTDARGLVTKYEYDVLNRLTFKSYYKINVTNPTMLDPDPSTQDVVYFYDGSIDQTTSLRGYTVIPPAGFTFDNAKTRQTAHLLAKGSTIYPFAGFFSFDALGKPKVNVQRVEGVDFAVNYSYDLAENIRNVTYPNGKSVSYSYSSADRVNMVRNEAQVSYLNNISYAPHGGMSQLKYGNSLNSIITETRTYNTRLQPIGLQAQTGGSSPTVVMNFAYDYMVRSITDVAGCVQGDGNNGNVYRIVDAVQNKQYDFCYDALNRLKGARGPGATANWSHVYAYDRYGNLSGNGLDPSVQIEPRTNRITTMGYGYDAAGNLTATPATVPQPQPHTYSYDAENRMTGVDVTDTSATAQYRYDGEGRRVEKIVGGMQTTYIYDLAGRVISEYEAPTAVSLLTPPEPVGWCPGSVKYNLVDHLGSPRVMTDQAGAVVERRDYYPFGGEITNTNNNQLKFTGKMRDDETKLDYFGARYYASMLGRFMSVDHGGPDPESPQSWNRYQYTYNNPLKFVDPDGHDSILSKLYNLIKTAGNKLTEFKEREELATIDRRIQMAQKQADLLGGGDPVKAYERIEQMEEFAMSAAMMSGGLKVKGLRETRLFSGVMTRLSALLGTEGIEVTDHAAKRIIQRIFGGELKGISLESIKSAIRHGEAYFDAEQGSYLLVRKGLAAVLGKDPKSGRFFLKTVEKFRSQKKLEKIDRKKLGLLVCEECSSPWLKERFEPEGPLRQNN